jgi:hypothetical protein
MEAVKEWTGRCHAQKGGRATQEEGRQSPKAPEQERVWVPRGHMLGHMSLLRITCGFRVGQGATCLLCHLAIAEL